MPSALNSRCFPTRVLRYIFPGGSELCLLTPTVCVYSARSKSQCCPQLQVEYPSTPLLKNGRVDPDKFETMTWRDLKHRLNPPEVRVHLHASQRLLAFQRHGGYFRPTKLVLSNLILKYHPTNCATAAKDCLQFVFSCTCCILSIITFLHK